MVKLREKIFKLSAYSLLLSYLGIVALNIIHFHTFDFRTSDLSFASKNPNKISHLSLEGSDLICPIHSVFNSLHNTIVANFSPLTNYQNNPEIIVSLKESSFPAKANFYHYILRAPPITLS